MSDTLKLEYKVGAIEFKAEGSADAVEQQRINFMESVLPAAVDAMTRTQAAPLQGNYIESTPQAPMLEASTAKGGTAPIQASEFDLSRTSLASFLKSYGALSDQDFTLFAAHFDELKNGTTAFSVENVKQYYLEGRRAAYSNNSELLRQLTKKGFIMDAPAPEGSKSGKYYMLTDAGISYIKEYVPKENNGEKKLHSKARKTASKTASVYATINADDLSIGKYPAVKSLSGAKEQVIMAMYIVTNEGRGEWFTVDDILYLLINIFEVPANVNTINGVFKRNKSMFTAEQDPSNKKAYRRKLLSGAKDYAKSLIENNGIAKV
ncbi:MAG: hypothetical protein IJU59_04355 [Firmicutes bacterium]|nr:hypothetical protein [Bacillota bacterium]